MNQVELVAVVVAACGAVSNFVLVLLMWSHQNKRFDDIYRYMDLGFKNLNDKVEKIEKKVDNSTIITKG